MLELTLLGVPKLSWQGKPLDRPSPKVFAVLCYLALQDREVARKDLLELFWREGKLSNLRYVLFKLREVEGSQSWLETDDHFVAVSAATDVEAFEDAVKRGQHTGGGAEDQIATGTFGPSTRGAQMRPDVDLEGLPLPTWQR